MRTTKDILYNINFTDAMIRFGITLLLPILMLLIDKNLIIYTAPVMAYLFTSAILRFCVIKYAWYKYFKHQAIPVFQVYDEN